MRLVDGQDVSSLDTPFELLPGCHVVTTPTQWIAQDSSGLLVLAQLPEYQIPLPMKPAHYYQVEVATARETLQGARYVYVRALERDTHGQITGDYRPVAGNVDPGTCRVAG